MSVERRAVSLELNERLVAMETLMRDSIMPTLTRLDERLFGNGRQGALDDLSDRIDNLEGWKMWVVGAVAAITVAFGAVEFYVNVVKGK